MIFVQEKVLGQCVTMSREKVNQQKPYRENENMTSNTIDFDQIVFKDLTNGQLGLFFFDSDRGCLYKIKKVYKELWEAKTEKFINVRIGKVGIFNNQRKISCDRLKKFLNKIHLKEGQGLFSSIASIVPKIFSLIEKVKTITTSSHLLPMLLDISSLLMQAMSPTYSNWTPSYLLGHLLRFYSLYIRGKALVMGQSTAEAFTLAAISMFLPNPLIEIIKRMNLFTGKKILDTPSSVLDCITGIIEFFAWCLSQIPCVPDCVKSFVASLSSFSERSSLLREMCDKLVQFSKSRSIMLEEEWRLSVRDLDSKLKNCEEILNYIKSSPTSMAKYKDFCRLVKSLDSYEKCSRKEPVAIVLEGPPGTRKSFIMANLTERMGKSVYTHVIKATTDGKDFYDTYNNEEIFLMDDVGQQGISQWRTIINMVSTVKLPLDCAAVELKDTKFFNSELVMCTTNSFSQLNGLTKSDCISDIKALWRRCHVFNFDGVSIVDGKMVGKVVYKRFCPYINAYINKFPFDSNIPSSMEVTDKNRLIAWMNVIIKKLVIHYESNYSENQLTDQDSFDIGAFETEFENLEFSEPQGEGPQGQGIFSKIIGCCTKAYISIVINYLRWSILTGMLFVIDKAFLYFQTQEIDIYNSNRPPQESVNWTYVLSVIATGVTINYLLAELTHWYFGLVDDCEAKEDDIAGDDVVSTWKSVSGQSLDNLGTLIDSVKNRMLVAEILHIEKSVMTGQICQVLISGHFVIGPQHAFQGKLKGILNAYKDWEHYRCNSVVLNNVPFEVVYENLKADLVIAKLPTYMLSPFRNCKDYFRTVNKTVVSKSPAIVTPGGSFKATRNFNLEKSMLTYMTYRNHVVEPGEFIEYEGFTAAGLSGSLLVDPIEGIIGMHVAGDKVYGNAIVYNLALRQKIHAILSGDNLLVDVESMKTLDEEFSGNKYETNLYQNVPLKTSIVASPLHGVFPTTKFPANLSVKGVKTVEKMAEKSFLRIPVIPSEEMEFAGKMFEVMIPEFSDITDKEIILGNSILAPLNKKSVNGFGLEKDKEYYIDFTKGEIKDNMKEMMEDLERKVIAKEFEMTDVLFYETLKDELRLEEKVDKPRSFRVCRLPIILWQKKIFGDLFQRILSDSDFNQVSLGTNPYTEWSKYYSELSKMSIVFDIDIKTFDGKQAAQMQDKCNEILLRKYKGAHPEMAAFLLEIIVRSWLLVRNKLMSTTHSLPSGIWLTGLLNSFYNRGYSACSFCRECMEDGVNPSISEFFTLLDRVCGDDKLCGAPRGLQKYFNAITLGNFFDSIGMTATTGTKGKIDSISRDITEVSFLKRTFAYHPILGKVMGPLDKETLLNSIQWFDSSKDMDDVMDGKLRSFQREMYLHPDGDKYVERLKSECHSRGIAFPLLTKDYIKHLYLEEPDTAYRMYISDNNKNYFF
nr:MAG: polyprotein 1 [Picornavirales sp.]